jgi:uncharacterized SAM-dependent methyltransferase
VEERCGSTCLRGAGAGIKTEILIAALEAPRLYVAVDISGDFLDQAVISLRHRFPKSAVEMHLVSLEAQTVVADGRSFDFAAGESIHTETSRKYNVKTVSAIVESAGWYIEEMWTDPRQSFGVFGLASL